MIRTEKVQIGDLTVVKTIKIEDKADGKVVEPKKPTTPAKESVEEPTAESEEAEAVTEDKPSRKKSIAKKK
jgi:hypothetical protein